MAKETPQDLQQNETAPAQPRDPVIGWLRKQAMVFEQNTRSVDIKAMLETAVEKNILGPRDLTRIFGIDRSQVNRLIRGGMSATYREKPAVRTAARLIAQRIDSLNDGPQ